MRKRIAVIGAGYSGLCAIKHFSLDPHFQITGFEQADKIGGVWKYPIGCDNYTEQDKTSPFYCRIYRDLRINAARDLMALEDLPFPSGPDSCCHWQHVADYLQDYARQFNLHSYIKFRHRVVQVVPYTSDHELPTTGTSVQWNITYKNLETKEITQEIFDAVAVCNGYFFKSL